MLNLEEKIIIDFFSRNTNVDFSKEIYISKEKLLDLLIKHRVFLLFYDELSSDVKQKLGNNYKITNYQLIKKKKRYYSFLKKFLIFLNDININYILLKGIANEIIIYEKLYSRVYGDVDVIINECDLEYLLVHLNEAGYKYEVNKFDDYYSHELLLNIKDDNEIFLVELKRRHRESQFKYISYYYNNKKFITWENIPIPVLNNEALFISSCIYIYNYIERTAGWLSSKKIRFCYFLDLYNFILKFYEELDYKKIIKETNEQKNIHKIILILQHLYKLFNNDSIYKIYLLFKKEYNHYEIIDYFDVGRINWNISIQDRIFNYDEIAKIVEKYLYGNFFINDKLYIKSQEHSLYSFEHNISFSYEFSLLNNMLQIKLINLIIPKNGEYVIYISLYCYNKYGEYIAPYLPISLRFLEKDIIVVNRFTVDFSCGKYIFESEKLMPYQNINTLKLIKDNINYELFIDLNKLDIIMKSVEDFRYQIELIHIKKENNIFVISRTNDDKDIPLKYECV